MSCFSGLEAWCGFTHMLLGRTHTSHTWQGEATPCCPMPQQLRVSSAGRRLAVQVQQLLPSKKASCPAPSPVSCFFSHLCLIAKKGGQKKAQKRNCCWQEDARHKTCRGRPLPAALQAAWRSRLRLQTRARWRLRRVEAFAMAGAADCGGVQHGHLLSPLRE